MKEGNQNCIRKKELSVKVFNKLSSYTRVESDNSKKFKLVLQNFSYENSFHSLDEYFELQKVKYIYIKFGSQFAECSSPDRSCLVFSVFA